MSKRKLHKITGVLLVALLLAISFAPAVIGATDHASTLQQVRAKEVKGTLPGGQFAKIWLALEPEQSGAIITVTAEWDRPDAQTNGVGFFILDKERLGRVGEDPLSSLATAAGDTNFNQNTFSNIQGAQFNAIGFDVYTIVVFNDSGTDANFTLKATNGFIVDGSNQVSDPNATPAAAETTTAETSDTSTEPTPTPAAAAASPVTTTVVATTTASSPAPSGATTVKREVRATQLAGDLPNQDDQHFLGLEPSQRDGEIGLVLTFDPQDSAELARRLNFWVLDEAGLTQFLRGTSPGELAIAAGSRTFRDDANERVARFKASGLGKYTVIVYNNSRVPGSYILTVDGGTLIDGDGQTKTAQAASVTSTSTVTPTTTSTTTTTTTAPASAQTSAPATTASGVAGQPGGAYTVKAGDTLAVIARDIYGNVQYYQQICRFNNIANCDLIEVGDVIKLPTLTQIQSGATAPAAAPAAVTTTVTPTRTTTTAPAASTAPTVTRPITTSVITTTRPVTSTGSLTTTLTATTTRPVTTTSVADDIVATLTADGRFTSLLEALQATGLNNVLKGRGPFTLFAPTEAAFNALEASRPGALQALLAEPTGQLTDLLRFHVVAGRLLAADLLDGQSATTTQGKPVEFQVQGSSIKVNGANVINKDIQTSNGVIHVIDAIIIPPLQ
jgi:uncharacterized surface protein with fasciclin (FAS1) repeats/nucleoid-associated protein YgaU